MLDYGQMIEKVLKDYLEKQSIQRQVQRENLRIIINLRGERLVIDLLHKGELIKKLSIDEIINQ